MISIMKNKLLKNIVSVFFIITFWTLVWYLAAFLLNSPLLLPTPHETLFALGELLITTEFYTVVLFTVVRVLLGLLFGIFVGIILAIICYRFDFLKNIISPAISVLRATPVATFVVLLYVLLKGNSSALSIVIAFVMVMPIVWQNTLDGFKSIPLDLIEVADVYELSFNRRFSVLIMPVLSRYIFPAIITSVGLAWKSEIAAEIIAYTKNSIGMYINDAKTFSLAPTLYAWTIVIICFSFILEGIAKMLLGDKK